MRQNPWHSLWKEFEFSPVFAGDKFGALFATHISWPQQTLNIGPESVHILTSQHPCNSRKLVVHTDAASRILDVQTIEGIRNFDTMSLTVLRLSPKPVIQMARTKPYGSNNSLVAYDLTLSKSAASSIDPTTIEIIDRKRAE
jgi:hypothetical protein